MRTPIDMNQIQALCDRIVEICNPDKIILFGSWAYGTPTPDSDVDLLVIMPLPEHPRRLKAEILTKANPEFEVDLLLRDSQKVLQSYEEWDPFIRMAFDHGRVCYERHSATVG